MRDILVLEVDERLAGDELGAGVAGEAMVFHELGQIYTGGVDQIILTGTHGEIATPCGLVGAVIFPRALRSQENQAPIVDHRRKQRIHQIGQKLRPKSRSVTHQCYVGLIVILTRLRESQYGVQTGREWRCLGGIRRRKRRFRPSQFRPRENQHAPKKDRHLVVQLSLSTDQTGVCHDVIESLWTQCRGH